MKRLQFSLRTLFIIASAFFLSFAWFAPAKDSYPLVSSSQPRSCNDLGRSSLEMKTFESEDQMERPFRFNEGARFQQDYQVNFSQENLAHIQVIRAEDLPTPYSVTDRLGGTFIFYNVSPITNAKSSES